MSCASRTLDLTSPGVDQQTSSIHITCSLLESRISVPPDPPNQDLSLTRSPGDAALAYLEQKQSVQTRL